MDEAESGYRLLDGGVSEAGQPYLAMEYVHGQNLQDVLRTAVRQKGTMQWSHAAQIVAEAAEEVAAVEAVAAAETAAMREIAAARDRILVNGLHVDTFIGLHDFAAYCKPREEATTIRTLLDYRWAREQAATA